MAPPRPRFTSFRGRQLANTLAQRLIRPIDTIRDLATKFGVRPYSITLLRTRWTGSSRGQGQEVVLSEEEILPTPKILDLDSLTEILTPVGLNEEGGLKVEQISGSYTEDQLIGRYNDGEDQDPNVQFFWEVQYRRPDGTHGERRRFTPRGAPEYLASKVQWVMRLEKAVMNRTRSGDLRP